MRFAGRPRQPGGGGSAIGPRTSSFLNNLLLRIGLFRPLDVASLFGVSGPNFQRIGHGGASALAPGNTLASFDAALEVGIDMIEFDVRGWRGELVLAHTVLDARLGRSLPLREALAHLASDPFAGIDFNVDVKHRGCERPLLDELRRSGLLHRTLISSQVAAVLTRVRELEPDARLGISLGGRLPRATHRWRNWRSQVLAGLAGGRWDALMAQHRLVDAGWSRRSSPAAAGCTPGPSTSARRSSRCKGSECTGSRPPTRGCSRPLSPRADVAPGAAEALLHEPERPDQRPDLGTAGEAVRQQYPRARLRDQCARGVRTEAAVEQLIAGRHSVNGA